MPLETASGVVYRMVYVTMNGKQVVHPCTKAVYNLIVTTKPDFDKKSDFVLTLDPSTDVVTHLTKQAKPDGDARVQEGSRRRVELKSNHSLALFRWKLGSTSRPGDGSQKILSRKS
jgi:hypothetical protein